MSFSRILSNVMTWRWPSTAETCSRRYLTNKNTILWQLCFDGPTHPHLNKTQRGWRTWRTSHGWFPPSMNNLYCVQRRKNWRLVFRDAACCSGSNIYEFKKNLEFCAESLAMIL
jgi:hypothetical protein